jgi:hypothetical protein
MDMENEHLILPLTREQFDKIKKGEILFFLYLHVGKGLFVGNRLPKKKELKNPLEAGIDCVPLSIADLVWDDIDNGEKVPVQTYKEGLSVSIISERLKKEFE